MGKETIFLFSLYGGGWGNGEGEGGGGGGMENKGLVYTVYIELLRSSVYSKSTVSMSL